MKVVLATSNEGKVKEFKELLGKDVIPFKDILGDIEIIEDGSTFKENAIIKAKAIFERLDKSYVVLADDSGITVPLLNNEPGIYSARYAGKGASDRDNLNKLVNRLKDKGVDRTKAYYTAAIAIATKDGVFTTHGWMWGDVITTPRGTKGFGYDPIFIPKGFDKTLGELSSDIKAKISHRSKALNLAKILLKGIV